MRVFNKKLNRLLAIMLASVMGATSLPATQVSADTPSSEYDISNDAASDDISDSKIPDEHHNNLYTQTDKTHYHHKKELSQHAATYHSPQLPEQAMWK